MGRRTDSASGPSSRSRTASEPLRLMGLADGGEGRIGATRPRARRRSRRRTARPGRRCRARRRPRGRRWRATSERAMIAVGRSARSSRRAPAMRPASRSLSGPLATGTRGPVDARGLEAGAPAVEPRRGRRGARRCARASGPVSPGWSCGSAMPIRRWPERGEVLGDGAGAALVVDVDVDHPGLGVEVDAHVGELAADGSASIRESPRVDAVDDEAVDQRVLDQRGAAALDPRDERQAEPLLLAAGRDAVEELDRARVGERDRERVVEHEPDRAGLRRATACGRRVGPGVAEPLGRLHHAVAQLGGELVGPVVGVRDRHAGDADGLGDGGERDAICGARAHLYR